eukprot:COSAG06_NODE_2870_length_6149_cov_32.617851_7_plen_119_part_00
MTRPLERLDTLVGHKHNVMQPRRVVSGTWWEVGGDTRASRWHYTKSTEEKLIICFWPVAFGPFVHQYRVYPVRSAAHGRRGTAMAGQPSSRWSKLDWGNIEHAIPRRILHRKFAFDTN